MAENPYLQLVRDRKQQDSARLEVSLQEGSKIPAERAAQAVSVSKETGVPLDVAIRSDVQRPNPYKMLLEGSPRLQEWLSDPVNASVAQEDLGFLGYVEKQWNDIIGRGYQGNLTVRQSRLGGKAVLGTITPEEREELRRIDASRQALQKLGPSGITGFVEGIPGAISEQIPIQFEMMRRRLQVTGAGALAGAGIGVVVGSVLPGLGTAAGALAGAKTGGSLGWRAGSAIAAGELEMNLAYLEYEDLGMDRETALGISALVGVVNGSLEMFGVEALYGKLPGIRKFTREGIKSQLSKPLIRSAITRYARTIGETMATEGVTEALQSMITKAGGLLGSKDFESVEDFFAELFSAENLEEYKLEARAGAQGGAGMSVVLSAPNLVQDVMDVRDARAREQAYLDLGQQIEQSKLQKISPDKMEEAVDQATESAKVYIDVDQWDTYWQSRNIDPAEVAREVTGDADVYLQVAEAQGQIAIPMAKYATKIAPTEHNQFFAREIRLDPEQMNAREADSFVAEQADQKIEKASEIEVQRQTLEQTTTAKLIDLGYSRATAETQARVYARMLTRQAEVEGRSVDDLIAERDMSIERYVMAPDGSIVNQDSIPTKQTETPEFKRWFGDSKVVDAEGRPLVVYHGTKADFDAFDPSQVQAEGGFWFAERKEFASVFGDSVVATYLAINNPLEISQATEAYTIDQWREILDEAGVQGVRFDSALSDHLPYAFSELMPNKGNVLEEDGNLLQAIKDAGYDGIHGPDEKSSSSAGKNETGPVWVAFRPEQIKSIYNRGTFDPNDPSILKQQADAPRGFLRIDRSRSPAKLSIGLLEKSDLSTFMHESAHAYLEIMRDFVGTLSGRTDITDIQKQYLDDSETLLKWLGIESWDQLGVDQHEQFARGFEAYLMEGKAPSRDLQSAFNRFKIWLTQIYRQLSALNVKLNDDIRGVMDRMLASQDEIEAARADLQIKQIFLDAESAGMTPAQFENYRKAVELANADAKQSLEQKLFDEWTREQRKWWKDETAKIEAEVEAELILTRPYKTIAALSGKDSTKLSRKAIEDTYGDDAPAVIDALKKHGIVRVKDAALPDDAAVLYGYGSGDEMVRELMRTPALRAEVRRRAGERMRTEYGDLMRDAAQMAQQARIAVLEGGQEKILEAELKALNALQRKVAPMMRTAAIEARESQRQGLATLRAVPGAQVFKQIAQGRVGQMRVRDLQPNTYLVAMRKAGKASETSLAKQDYVTAAVHKQAQMLNLQMYLETTKARTEAKKKVDYVNSFKRPNIRKRLGKTEYLEAIDSILERFDFSTSRSLREIDWGAEMRGFVEQQKEQNIDVHLPPELFDVTFKKSYKEMTTDELSGVHDAVRHLDHLSRSRDKLLKILDARRFDEFVEAMTETIEKNRPPKLIDIETRLPQTRISHLFRSYLAMHRKASSYVRVFDGHQDGGISWRALVRPFNDAADTEATMRHEAALKLDELFKPLAKRFSWVKTKASVSTMGGYEGGMYQKKFYPELKTSRFNGNLSHAGKLSLALNWGNEGNRQRVLDGYGWKEDSVQKVLDTLTREDWAFVEGVWRFIDTYWPQIAALSKRVDGIEPERVKGVPVRTPFGIIEGGYYPIVRNADTSQMGFRESAQEAADAAMRGIAFRSQTKHGHREARAAKVVGQPIDLSLNVIFKHVNDVIHDLTHYEAIVDAKRVLKDSRVADTIRRSYSPEVYNELDAFVNDVATGDVQARTAMEQIFNHLRVGVSIAGMGLNMMTAAIQVTGFTQSVVRLRPYWAWAGLKAFYADPFKQGKAILEKSALMRQRSSTMLREINEIRNTVEGGNGRITGAYFYLIAKMQQTVDFPTWMGQYLKSIDQGMTEDMAVATADQAVLDAQMGGQTKDLSRIMRGTPYLKLFTNFYSYFNATMNLTAESINRTDFTKPKDVGAFLGDMLLLYTAPAVMGAVIRSLLTPGEDGDDLMDRIVDEQLSFFFAPLVGVRELGSIVGGFYGYQGPAGTRFFAEAGKLAKQIQQGELDEPFWKAANQTAGILFHYPAGQVQRTVAGMIALAEGETDNPLALVSGPPKD